MSAESGIVKPAETAVARERLCEHPLLSNGSAANGGTVGSGIFCAVRAGAV
jgi:hypothetical protein